VRDRAILETVYSTGVRRSELAGLRRYDLDHERGTVLVRQGKGRKDRVIPIGERALHWVDRYLLEARPRFVSEPDEGFLFLTSHGDPFTPEGMTDVVRKYVRASGVKKPGACHLFRHTMATVMLENGADIRFIQQMLGHAKLTTTEIYTQVSVRKLKEVHRMTHPTGRLEEEPSPAASSAAAAPPASESDPPATREELLATLAAEVAEEDTGGDEDGSPE
jgi:integrase/recombinase XerD